MYNTFITTPAKALSHLFIHCCFKDGRFTESEIEEVSKKLVGLDLQKELNFKDEVLDYKTYSTTINDEKAYLEFLIQLINPTNEVALYSYCLELGLSDAELDVSENNLFKTIGNILALSEEERNLMQKLYVQRKVVETNKFF